MALDTGFFSESIWGDEILGGASDDSLGSFGFVYKGTLYDLSYGVLHERLGEGCFDDCIVLD
jgi:hypothetical protein